jgi:hypothetical protein
LLLIAEMQDASHRMAFCSLMCKLKLTMATRWQKTQPGFGWIWVGAVDWKLYRLRTTISLVSKYYDHVL